MKHLHGKSIANETSSDNILILVKPFSGARTEAMKHYSCKKKRSFPLRISSVNVTKSAENCKFGHIY